MKKWLRRLLIAAALVGLTLGILYECATHVGRGWLFGEAFFEGRPTSYWCARCRDWRTRFADEECMLDWVAQIPFRFPDFPDANMCYVDRELPSCMPKEDTTISRWLTEFTGLEDPNASHLYRGAPLILCGHPNSKDVLNEIRALEEFEKLAAYALERTTHFRKAHELLIRKTRGNLP